MIRARLLRKLKASGGPTIWLSLAKACHVASGLGVGRRRWTARKGYALRQAERWDEAMAAYVAAIGGSDALDTRRLAPGEVPAGASDSWYYYLGSCLRKSGDPAEASRLVRIACDSNPTNTRWLSTLAQIEEEAGNLSESLKLQQRAVDLRGNEDPRLRLRLASMYEQIGQWDEARRVLVENLQHHPDHPASHRLLADVLLTSANWGGTFLDTTAGRLSGRFVFSNASTTGSSDEPTNADPSRTARTALERAIELSPAKPTWLADLAEARLADQDPQGAIRAYQDALRAAENSDGRWVLGAKQRWQFRLEHTYHSLGKSRVEDPLFECQLREADAVVSGPQQVAGLFNVRLTHVGLVVSGFIAAEDCGHVEILLNGILMRSVNISQDGFFPRFSLSIKRRTVALLPAQSEIEVRTASGARLLVPSGGDKVHITVPHGDGRLPDILASGGKLDKKGVISPSPAETRQRQERYLEIYSKVRNFFEDQLGRPVFLMYGTLLGYYRGGDFIPGDDDFDAGYVSDKADPVAVKEETKQIIIKLVKAGFTVSFNRRGRLFRVQLDRGATDGYHVDLRPLWFQGGKLWVHNHVCLPGGREDFLPVVEGKLRNVSVSIPRNTEAFLRGHYGPGWKVPDPGFTYYASEVAPAVRQNLNKALITVAEYKKLAERVRREVGASPTAGRFVSVGSQDLYPLEEFIS